MTHQPTFREAVAAAWRGESLARVSMDAAFAGRAVPGGLVVDVGGAKSASYLGRLALGPDSRIESVDGATHSVDFEMDPLPFADGEAAAVICCNVLEHVYDHRHLVAEIRRVVAPGGTLIGFVPFFVQYHPDPRDYFRYTNEALERILRDAGFASVAVEAVGQGPVGASVNSLLLSLPRVLRPVLVALAWPFARLSLRLRPKLLSRFPLGYVFEAR
jgi:SAM-dependent methyltransferase